MDAAHLLIDYAEAERAGGWSLRSALVRYAQPEPVRAGAVLELIRRLDAALAPHRSKIEKPGAGQLLDEQARQWKREPFAAGDAAVPLLGVAIELDELADEFVAWALDITQPRPTDAVDQRCRRIAGLLDELGVPTESRDPSEWPRGRNARGV